MNDLKDPYSDLIKNMTESEKAKYQSFFKNHTIETREEQKENLIKALRYLKTIKE